MLTDVLSCDGLAQALNQAQVVLKLRLVSKNVMLTMESIKDVEIDLRLNDAGVDGLTAEFLQKWHGHLRLHCRCPWKPDSRWFKDVGNALLNRHLRLNLLSLTVEENNLHPLVQTLVEIGPAIQMLEIDYCGNCADVMSAVTPLASLGRALTMKISLQGVDTGGSQISSLLPRLLASRIGISSISFRSAR